MGRRFYCSVSTVSNHIFYQSYAIFLQSYSNCMLYLYTPVHGTSFLILLYSSVVRVSFLSILDVRLVGRTSRGHTGGRSHRISHPPSCGSQPFLSLVDREVEFCVLNNRIVLHLLGIFIFCLGKIPVTKIRTHVLTCQKVSRLPTEQPGRPAQHVVQTASMIGDYFSPPVLVLELD